MQDWSPEPPRSERRHRLKRDVAYLKRLWKTIETRIEKAGVPCELYTESDLVLRTIRDQLGPEITKIVVDSESKGRHGVPFGRGP